MDQLLHALKIIITISFLYFLTSIGDPSKQIEIMDVGDFHGDEVSAIDGEEWFMLFKKGNKVLLQKTTIKVDLFGDLIIDNPGEKTGKKVSTESTNEVILLLKNIPTSYSGEIETITKWPMPLPGDATSIKMKYGGNNYTLEMQIEQPDAAESTARLTFSDGKNKQVLSEYRSYMENGIYGFGDDAAPTLIWAGDIDGDKQLDLLLDLTNHYNVSELTLFLSSTAAKGELAGKIAAFRTAGC